MNRILIITALLLFSLTGYAKNWEGNGSLILIARVLLTAGLLFGNRLILTKCPTRPLPVLQLIVNTGCGSMVSKLYLKVL